MLRKGFPLLPPSPCLPPAAPATGGVGTYMMCYPGTILSSLTIIYPPSCSILLSLDTPGGAPPLARYSYSVF